MKDGNVGERRESAEQSGTRDRRWGCASCSSASVARELRAGDCIGAHILLLYGWSSVRSDGDVEWVKKSGLRRIVAASRWYRSYGVLGFPCASGALAGRAFHHRPHVVIVAGPCARPLPELRCAFLKPASRPFLSRVILRLAYTCELPLLPLVGATGPDTMFLWVNIIPACKGPGVQAELQ